MCGHAHGVIIQSMHLAAAREAASTCAYLLSSSFVIYYGLRYGQVYRKYIPTCNRALLQARITPTDVCLYRKKLFAIWKAPDNISTHHLSPIKLLAGLLVSFVHICHLTCALELCHIGNGSASLSRHLHIFVATDVLATEGILSWSASISVHVKETASLRVCKS